MNDMAFTMFKLMNSGYCCTQIMLKMALDAEDIVNEDLIKSMNGLCMGVGGTQNVCGVLTGGIAIIGLYAGKGKDTEYPKDNFSILMSEYIEWFESEFESTQCEDIIGVQPITRAQTNDNYMLKCGDILTKSYEKIVELLQDNGYEYGSRES